MELFNSSIHRVEELLSVASPRKWSYDGAKCWKDAGRNELVMLREAAFELGGSAKSAVSFSCFTTRARFPKAPFVWLY